MSDYTHNLYSEFRKLFAAPLLANTDITDRVEGGARGITYGYPPSKAQYPRLTFTVLSDKRLGSGAPLSAHQLEVALTIHSTDPDDGDALQAAINDMIGKTGETPSWSVDTLANDYVGCGEFSVDDDIEFGYDPRHVARDVFVEMRTFRFNAIIVAA